MLDIGNNQQVDIDDFVKIGQSWFKVVDLITDPEDEYPIIVDDWGTRVAYSGQEISDVRLPSEMEEDYTIEF